MIKNAFKATVTQESIVIDNFGYSPCPECWELNTAGDACVMAKDNNCCEMSCDNAKMTFSFEPKMFRLTDASNTAFFGSNGPKGNTLTGKYEYSHGLGASGQSVSVDGDEMLFRISENYKSLNDFN